jgi:hypothetical protein
MFSAVLNDNALAQSFYRGLGATEDPEWRRWIMPTDALDRLVEGAYWFLVYLNCKPSCSPLATEDRPHFMRCMKFIAEPEL